MATKLPASKAVEAMINACADMRMDPTAFTAVMQEQAAGVQEVFWNVIVSYIYTMSRKYELGLFIEAEGEIVRLCKKVKDLALEDELDLVVYPRYGDYEKANQKSYDLTEYDSR